MRKFLLALIACLVAVIAYASPGSPYLSYGWRPTGGGGSTIALDGTVKSSTGVFGTSLNVSLSTAGSGENIYCTLAIGGAAVSAPGISGSTLGAFTSEVSVSSSTGDSLSAVYFKHASATLTTETITASWTGSSAGQLVCFALTGAKDITGLTPGTDFGTATAHSTPNAADTTISLTTKASNSWTAAASNIFACTTFTADANTSSYAGPYVPGGGNACSASLYRTAQPLAIGTYAIGATADTGNGYAIAGLEILAGP